jgi:hypothetical protein
MQCGLLKTDYGENDFLITYDDKYYFQFRHFIFNSNNQHSYDFYTVQRQDSIYVEAYIQGEGKMQFTKTYASNYRRNASSWECSDWTAAK